MFAVVVVGDGVTVIVDCIWLKLIKLMPTSSASARITHTAIMWPWHSRPIIR